MKRSSLMVMLAGVLIAGCGGRGSVTAGQASRPTTHTPTFNAALQRCATTWRSLVVHTTSDDVAADETWVAAFLTSYEQPGASTMIGQEASLTFDGRANECWVAFIFPGTDAGQMEAVPFTPGATSWRDDNAGLTGGVPGATPGFPRVDYPNATIGPNGALVSLSSAPGESFSTPPGSVSTQSTASPQPTTSSAPAYTPTVTPSCGTIAVKTGPSSTGDGPVPGSWAVAKTGVACSTAVSVLTAYLDGHGKLHSGETMSDTYTVVDGWQCAGPSQLTAGCAKGDERIGVYVPGTSTYP